MPRSPQISLAMSGFSFILTFFKFSNRAYGTTLSDQAGFLNWSTLKTSPKFWLWYLKWRVHISRFKIVWDMKINLFNSVLVFQKRNKVFLVDQFMWLNLLGGALYLKLLSMSHWLMTSCSSQPVYFHTPILDSSIMVVIELVTTLTPKDPLPGQEVQGKSHSAGWSLMRLFSSDQPLHEVGGTQKNAVKK